MIKCAWENVYGWDAPNVQAAGEVYATSVGRRLFEYFMMRCTAPDERCLVAEVALETGIHTKDVIAFFRTLNEASLGLLTLGRKGRKTRFTWRCEPREIVEAAMNDGLMDIEDRSSVCSGVAETQPRGSGDGAFEATRSSPRAEAEEHLAGVGDRAFRDGLVDHSFRLRSDLIVTLRLPASLTSLEGRRLAMFVSALALSS
jgi:hypothetical protein